jgi:hypothetical protein
MLIDELMQLDDASERDKHRLIDDINLSTIIDLRTKYVSLFIICDKSIIIVFDSTEHELATRRRQNSISLNSSEDISIPETADRPHLLDLPGVQRHFISLTGRAFERLLLWRLDWYNFMYAPPSIFALNKSKCTDSKIEKY